MHLCWKLALMMMVLVCVTGQHVNDYRRPTRVGVTCCKTVSKGRIPPETKLIGYKHQNALSPCVDAIIFYTEKDKYCSDPNARWIRQRLEGLKKIED
ncbi:chemokine (C-C motif) ligand 34b, duplicate 4 isoform X2 [Megalobrama amblycephala]|uniref:chemokine (C-C motif) ligand 34b, duplicate 4 isoform X2 n=1 Tax=Megalobrama amblycephala TaxID=75352 RepID=UPI0020143301|nr:chemokine (C-C motif) ligand 34b, duplicate 4 isoform X2 [Megalobrama amblycephala]